MEEKYINNIEMSTVLKPLNDRPRRIPPEDLSIGVIRVRFIQNIQPTVYCSAWVKKV